MTHGITIENGVPEFAYTGALPWHRLGVEVDHHMTPREALFMAGLNWEVFKAPIFVRDPSGKWMDKIDGKWATRRSDNWKVLGVVGDDYHPLQNREATDFIEYLVDEGGSVEVAGSLRHGAVVFWTVKLTRDQIEVRDGDSVVPYLVVRQSHDGSCSFNARLTPIRVVCVNTLAVAMRGRTGIYAVHRSGILANIKRLADTLGIIRQDLAESVRVWRELANSPIDVSGFLERLIPAPSTKRGSTEHGRLRETLSTLFRQGLGNEGRTAWDAYNAVTEYVSHGGPQRGEDSPERRFARILDGSGDRLSRRALAILTG